MMPVQRNMVEVSVSSLDELKEAYNANNKRSLRVNVAQSFAIGSVTIDNYVVFYFPFVDTSNDTWAQGVFSADPWTTYYIARSWSGAWRAVKK